MTGGLGALLSVPSRSHWPLSLIVVVVVVVVFVVVTVAFCRKEEATRFCF